MPAPSVTYTFTNATTADATEVNQNFTDLVNSLTDGLKDLTVNAITANGAVAFNGTVTLGNAAADDITVTGSLASSIPIKTNNTYDIGAATLGLRKIYLGNGGAGATCDIVSASHATTREYSVPDCGAAANFVMTELAQTITGVKTFSSGIAFANETLSSYDEGTFTPTLKGATTNPTTSYTTQSGTYVRIGKIVFVAVTLTLNTVTIAGSGAAYIDISGISINSDASSTKRYEFACRGATFAYAASNTYLVGEMSTSNAIYLSTAGSGQATDLPVDNVGDGDSIWVSGFYFV